MSTGPWCSYMVESAVELDEKSLKNVSWDEGVGKGYVLRGAHNDS